MSKAGHTFTAGRCVPSATYPFMIECEVPGLADGYDSYVVAEAKTHSLIGRETAEANTAFIAEAFTVAHETGLTPRQLAERCEALLVALLEIETICTESAGDCRRRMGTRVGNTIAAARAALSKATAGGAV